MSPEALLIAAVLTAELAAASTLVEPTSGILDTSALRICCLAGSAIGAVLAIATESESTKTGNELRALARKLLASAIGGVLFTPLLMRYFQIRLDPDTVLCWSGVVAFLSVATLQIASGVYRKAIRKYLEDKASAVVGPLDGDVK